MEHNVETSTIEDFERRPSKKAKCSESSLMDDPLPSPTLSTSSLVSECPESIRSESNNQKNDDPVPSPQSPTMSTLSPVSELINDEAVSQDGDKQTEEPKHIINDVTYDYLPQGKILTYYFYFCTYTFHHNYYIIINALLIQHMLFILNFQIIH